jgi:hypothetical protein
MVKIKEAVAMVFVMIAALAILAYFVLAPTNVTNATNVTKPAKTYNLTNELTSNTTTLDSILGQPVHKNDPRLADGTLIFALDSTGKSNATISMSVIALHNIGPFTEWTVINSNKKQFNLSGGFYFIHTMLVDVLKFNRMYLVFDDVEITVNGTTHKAIMPTNNVTIDGEFITMSPDEVDGVVLHILDEKSFFVDTAGNYIFAPQINIKVYRNVSNSDKFGLGYLGNTINDKLWTDVTVVMNEAGNVQIGYKITNSSWKSLF